MTEPVHKTFQTDEGHVGHTRDGKLHSVDGAAAMTYPDGTSWWYHHGKIHREDGPAVQWSNGVSEWWQDNQRHRDQGPAVIFPNTAAIAPDKRGIKQWWVRGKLIKEEVPPPVARYRAILKQAYAACFGGKK